MDSKWSSKEAVMRQSVSQKTLSLRNVGMNIKSGTGWNEHTGDSHTISHVTHTRTHTHTKMSQKISKSSNNFLREAWDTEQSMSWHWRSKRAFPCRNYVVSGHSKWSLKSNHRYFETNRKWKPSRSITPWILWIQLHFG